MKIIKYQLCTEVNHGTEDKPDIQQVFSSVALGWSEANETIAKAEAYNGEYTIEDDGEPEPTIPPTNDELAAENKRLKAQMEMQAQNITFLENCLLEMGDIVYA